MLPLIEYTDYIIDQNIKYVNNQLQNLQNRGLRIALNQHIKRYDEADDVSYTRTTDNRNMRLGTLVIQGQLVTGT